MPRARAKKEEEAPSDVSDIEADEELVFMSVLFDRGELGVAIYNALTTSLKTLQLQIADAQELEEVKQLQLELMYAFELNENVLLL
ncbi:unnamed protein product [Phytophthora lilii]|uniref:Unnamed protein product n=1 Tax=Phytophthora lilii TaxID=2077276 RepID=A0A9W6TD32_9STRA|nr:unnamed protein product [Phytophthora lilii]